MTVSVYAPPRGLRRDTCSSYAHGENEGVYRSHGNAVIETLYAGLKKHSRKMNLCTMIWSREHGDVPSKNTADKGLGEASY